MNGVVPQTVEVDVKPAWASKINWAQLIGFVSTLLTLVLGPQYEIPIEVQLQLVAGINAVIFVATWIIRTWFTTDVTKASAQKLINHRGTL